MSSTGSVMALSDWERLEDPPGQRLELISGRVRMNPAPRIIHQQVVRLLTNALADACGPEHLAVFDIEWRIRAADPSVLSHAPRPDVTVAPLTALREGSALWESPLVVVEVLSPGNRKPDIAQKRALYFEQGAGHYVEVTITGDEREVAITWHRRGSHDWVETTSARGEALLQVDDPFDLVIRPNELLF